MDTDFASLPAANSIAATDSFVSVRGGTPYRVTAPLPAIASSGQMSLIISEAASAAFRVRNATGNDAIHIVGNDGVLFGTIGLTTPSASADFVVRGGNSLNLGAGGASRLQVTTLGHLIPLADNAYQLGGSSVRFSVVYAATGSINTSDEREKREIGEIPEEWLDAWGEVEWCRFKFVNGTRWHVGLVAQRVHAAFQRRGLDAFDIGLCCFDAWEEQREPVAGKNGAPTKRMRVVMTAGDRWGLRYDECFAMEAAWHRRERARDREEIAQLKAALAAMNAQ